MHCEYPYLPYNAHGSSVDTALLPLSHRSYRMGRLALEG